MRHSLKMTPEKIRHINAQVSKATDYKERRRVRLHLAAAYGVSFRTILLAK